MIIKFESDSEPVLLFTVIAVVFIIALVVLDSAHDIITACKAPQAPQQPLQAEKQ